MRLAACLGLASTLVLAAAAHAVVAMPSSGLPSSGRVAPAGATTLPLTRVEYFCSPGFEPSYGGTCVAVPPRAEIELFVDQPIYETHSYRRIVRHRRHGLRERF